jgi:predicted nucleic acid-binding protein
VLISAALKPGGLQRTTFLLATTKPARLYVTRPILEEYADVLSPMAAKPPILLAPAREQSCEVRGSKQAHHHS